MSFFTKMFSPPKPAAIAAPSGDDAQARARMAEQQQSELDRAAREKASQQAEQDRSRRRSAGLAGTVRTGAQGLLGAAPVTARTLLGG